jgi:hypothetical protein
MTLVQLIKDENADSGRCCESNLPVADAIRYDELVLGKTYLIKKKGQYYTGMYYMHYRKWHDKNDPLTFENVTPNPGNKRQVEFNMSDEYYEL